MRVMTAAAGVALAAALALSGAGPAWAGSLPGGDDDGHHHGSRAHCPSATSEPTRPADLIAGLGSVLSPGAPGPVPPLPTAGAPQHPDRDPFYRGPEGFEACAPGTVLRSRVVSITGLPALTDHATAYQLLFRSTDARGEPIAAVTTLLRPRVPAPGPTKLLSYQVAEDSLTTGCAPSYTLRTGSGLPQPVENTWLTPVLAAGWTVSIPDHQGPRSEFAVGPTSGRVALDSIRAVERFGPAGLGGVHTPVGLMGYSGGSVPTLWANALAPDYAPELSLVGAASGGVLADLGGVIRVNPGPPLFGATIALPVALQRAYPDLDLDSLLNARGRALADRLGRDGNGCFGLLTAAPFDSVRTDTRFSDVESYLAAPRFAKALAKTNLTTGPRLSLPTLIVQGTQDELVPTGQVNELVTANCRRGASVDYRPVPGEHVSTIASWVPLSIAFFNDRFAGRPAASNCS